VDRIAGRIVIICAAAILWGLVWVHVISASSTINCGTLMTPMRTETYTFDDPSAPREVSIKVPDDFCLRKREVGLIQFAMVFFAGFAAWVINDRRKSPIGRIGEK